MKNHRLSGVSYCLKLVCIELDLGIAEKAKRITFHGLVGSFKLHQQEVTLEVLLHDLAQLVGLTADQKEQHSVSLQAVFNSNVDVFALDLVEKDAAVLVTISKLVLDFKAVKDFE